MEEASARNFGPVAISAVGGKGLPLPGKKVWAGKLRQISPQFAPGTSLETNLQALRFDFWFDQLVTYRFNYQKNESPFDDSPCGAAAAAVHATGCLHFFFCLLARLHPGSSLPRRCRLEQTSRETAIRILIRQHLWLIAGLQCLS